VVIDSINGFVNAMAGEQTLVPQMHELLTFLNQRGVVTFLVVAVAGMVGTSMTTPVDISYLSDNVLLLRFFEAGGRLRKAISVVKKRGSAHEDSIRELVFSTEGVRVGEALSTFQGILTGNPAYFGSTVEQNGKPNGPHR
jgi:circadian clock protein KaiC